MALIELNEVSVSFPIYDSSSRSLKNRILSSTTGGQLGPKSKHETVVVALDSITGTLRDGARVGLVGHNGAGKSTLLRVLAGIYEPSSGNARIDGHVAPLFDIGLGMDLEATGYENIMIRGLFLGLSRAEIKSRISEIAAFTELGGFLDLPVRTYSDGMRLRLAFAVSTAIDPEILLLDEGIAAGDAAFLAKANARLRSFAEKAAIIVLASHSTHLIRNLCKTAVLLERGKIAAIGQVDEVLALYDRQAKTTA
jgi:ABC-2 type transport system ATP-binding protein/lipopolysaccharide transport system ATP-binding protein